MENSQIADILDEIADLLELTEANDFRVRSYRSAARSARGLSQRLEDLQRQDQDLSQLPNIGKSTAEKIDEILRTGTCQRLKDLRKGLPPHLTDIMKVPGLGARKTKLLYDQLGVKTLKDLEKACRDQRVRELEDMGEKTEQKILKGIQTLSSVSGRILLKEASDHVDSLGKHLDSIQAIRRWEIAGSFRRGQETIGDLDFLIHASPRGEAMDAILQYAPIAHTDSRGNERVTVHLQSGLQVDFRFFEPKSFGSAMLYFTGSKAHNIAIRRIAQDRGWKLNEYGLFHGDHLLAGKSEESVYRRLNMAWVPPELREDRGEIEAAQNHELPRLIEPEDIRGDLHAHTTATDGADSIEAMAEAAKRQGYQFLAITDHSKAVTVAGGLTESRLRKHAEAIRQVDAGMSGFWLLAGVEVDILKSGGLDLKEEVLEDLDWVVASVHSHWNLSRKQMTDRLVAAVGSGVVDCIGHPMGRMIGRRDPVPLDVDRLFQACAEHGVRLEINAQPRRLDLLDTYCQRAKQAGVGFTISTDAHKTSDLALIRFGIQTARRGWLEKKDVLNAHSLATLRKKLGS